MLVGTFSAWQAQELMVPGLLCVSQTTQTLTKTFWGDFTATSPTERVTVQAFPSMQTLLRLFSSACSHRPPPLTPSPWACLKLARGSPVLEEGDTG